MAHAAGRGLEVGADSAAEHLCRLCCPPLRWTPWPL